MRVAVVLALVACGKGDRAAAPPAVGSGSGSGSGSGVFLTDAARCSGRWVGRFKWTTQNCSEATLADVTPFELSIRAKDINWIIETTRPEIAHLAGSDVTWELSPPSCQVRLDYDLALPKPRTGTMQVDLENGPGGLTAHARMQHRGLDKDTCDATGTATPEFLPDDGRVPEIPFAHEQLVGRYALTIDWEPPTCDPGMMYPSPELSYSIAIDKRHRLVATGLPWTVDSVEARDFKMRVTTHADVASLRHVLVQDVEPDALGTVTFTALDGDLVMCTRKGTLRGTKTR